MYAAKVLSGTLVVVSSETGAASSTIGRMLRYSGLILSGVMSRSEIQKPLSYDMDRPVGERKVEVVYADLSSCSFF